ncbi:MAG: succinylglutamate desuccinylase/aspartoacylase family protein [Hyphomicrobiales bacterium]
MSALDVVLDEPGRHHGALRVPWSRDRSAYGELVVPVIVLNGARGPTALLSAGVHGDEYEGQIVLPALARSLEAGRLHGRLIILPRANPMAAAAGRRTSPADGGNLARLFPGDPAFGPTAALAAAITRHVLPLADAVIDLHAGGASLEYIPCAWGRLPHDAKLAARVINLLLAFGGKLAAVTAAPASGGTLVATALDMGKPAIAAELGGAGTATTQSLDAARQGVLQALAHLGMVEPAARTAGETRLMRVRPEHFLRSPARGLFEPAVGLGAAVAAGAIAGWLHDPERPEREPEPLAFPSSGLVICRRVPTPCEAGDVLAHLAEDCSREALLGALV